VILVLLLLQFCRDRRSSIAAETVAAVLGTLYRLFQNANLITHSYICSTDVAMFEAVTQRSSESHFLDLTSNKHP
jgi:hypothetical protein